jgi:hypothetical protein
MRKLWLLFAILVAAAGFSGCSDSTAPKELGPLTDSSIVFTGLTLNTHSLGALSPRKLALNARRRSSQVSLVHRHDRDSTSQLHGS